MTATTDLTRLRAELDAYKREREELIRERDEARAEIERLRAAEERDAEYLEEVLRKHDEGSGIAICSWCALPTNSDEASKRAHQVSCPKSPLVAQLAEREAACAAMRFEIEGAQRHLRAAGNDYPSDLAVKDALEHVERALSSSAGAALLAEVERLRELTGVMQERLERFENIEDAARLVCEWAVTVAVDGSTVKSAARNYLSGLANDAALTPAPAAGKEPDHG